MFIKDVKLGLVDLSATEAHIHSGLQCLFVLRGTTTIEVEGKEIVLSAEDLLVIDSNQLHAIKTDTSNVVLMLEIEKDYILNECGGMAVGRLKCHCIGHSDESSRFYGLKKALTQMLYIAVKKEEGYQLDFKIELLRFLYVLYTCFKDGKATEKAIQPEKTKNIRPVLSYMNDNYYRPLKLEEMAKREYMSPQYFSKYFKRKTGYNFLEYLTSLRLKKAVHALISTEDSIVKIALDHGFANGKSFNEAFKREFQDTPGNFRKQHRKEDAGQAKETDSVEIDLEVEIDLKDFMRYVKRYDINFEKSNISKKYYEFDMKKEKMKELCPQENILNIGKVESAGYTNLFEQLETLRDRLSFQYVYFELEDYFIPNNIQYSLILYNQFFRTVDHLKKLNMIPFLQIKTYEVAKYEDPQQIKEHLKQRMETFLYCMKAVYTKDFLRQWKIEILVPKDTDNDVKMLAYETLYRALKQRDLMFQVGYYTHGGTSDIFRLMKERECVPDFITFGAFPIERKKHFIPNQFFYDGLRSFYREILDEIKEDCIQQIGEVPPLYMIRWNTLMGDLVNESILYFRSAIIVEALLDVNCDIKGAGYWADSAVSTRYSQDSPMSSLALYMMDDVRRPIYPVLEAMTRLGTNIIHEDKNILVSHNDKGEYGILIWNPKYLNPSYSLDDSTTESLTRNIELKLVNIDPGIYQVKKVTCNKEHSGAITQIVNAGYPDFTDMDVFDYIQYNIANGLTVYEGNIYNGSYVLNTNLLYNSVILYIIKKKQ